MEAWTLREVEIEIEEGFVGGSFIPSFVTQGRAGGGGASIGLILWLLGYRQKKKKRKGLSLDRILRLLRILPTLDALKLIGKNL